MVERGLEEGLCLSFLVPEPPRAKFHACLLFALWAWKIHHLLYSVTSPGTTTAHLGGESIKILCSEVVIASAANAANGTFGRATGFPTSHSISSLNNQWPHLKFWDICISLNNGEWCYIGTNSKRHSCVFCTWIGKTSVFHFGRR